MQLTDAVSNITSGPLTEMSKLIRSVSDEHTLRIYLRTAKQHDGHNWIHRCSPHHQLRCDNLYAQCIRRDRRQRLTALC